MGAEGGEREEPVAVRVQMCPHEWLHHVSAGCRQATSSLMPVSVCRKHAWSHWAGGNKERKEAGRKTQFKLATAAAVDITSASDSSGTAARPLSPPDSVLPATRQMSAGLARPQPHIPAVCRFAIAFKITPTSYVRGVCLLHSMSRPPSGNWCHRRR